MKVGIIGGGQLGMMLTEAAQKMPEIDGVVVIDPTPGCPAEQAGAMQIVAGFGDESAIRSLAGMVDVITYEIESGNADVLESVSSETAVNPSPDTLRTIQDKFVQKTFLSEHGIPVGEFMAVEGLEDVRRAADKFGLPFLLKARRDAYDGRGNYRIERPEDIESAYGYFEGRKTYAEKLVRFEMEVSVIAARNTRGDIRTYPLVENMHKNNILHVTVAPARVSPDIAARAESLARNTMEVLRGAGVFGIEMFVAGDNILINEIAPRVHNSGHHTLVSSATSQFEQHLRAILGMELGDTTLQRKTIMYNILGPDGFTGRYRPVRLDGDDIHLKMYGKKESKPQRKMGHFNLTGSDDTPIDDLVKRAMSIGGQTVLEPA